MFKMFEEKGEEGVVEEEEKKRTEKEQVENDEMEYETTSPYNLRSKL